MIWNAVGEYADLETGLVYGRIKIERGLVVVTTLAYDCKAKKFYMSKRSPDGMVVRKMFRLEDVTSQLRARQFLSEWVLKRIEESKRKTMNHKRYFVTPPVEGGYAFWNVTRNNFEGENEHVAVISKSMPNAEQEALDLCARLNAGLGESAYAPKKAYALPEKAAPEVPKFDASKITDNPELDFKPLDDEEYRVYEFNTGNEISGLRIDNPVALAVSKSGGHRVLDSEGISHYIMPGWLHLYWKVKPGRKPFAF